MMHSSLICLGERLLGLPSFLRLPCVKPFSKPAGSVAQRSRTAIFFPMGTGVQYRQARLAKARHFRASVSRLASQYRAELFAKLALATGARKIHQPATIQDLEAVCSQPRLQQATHV